MEVVEVHRVEAVDVEFGEVVFWNHSQADLLGLLLLLLLRWNLELRSIEVHVLGFRVLLWCLLLLLLWLRWLLLRCDGRLMLLLGLLLGRTERGRVLADVVDEWREGWMAEKSFDQATVALVLLQESLVLTTEALTFLGLNGNFAFELLDIF